MFVICCTYICCVYIYICYNLYFCWHCLQLLHCLDPVKGASTGSIANRNFECFHIPLNRRIRSMETQPETPLTSPRKKHDFLLRLSLHPIQSSVYIIENPNFWIFPAQTSPICSPDVESWPRKPPAVRPPTAVSGSSGTSPAPAIKPWPSPLQRTPSCCWRTRSPCCPSATW